MTPENAPYHFNYQTLDKFLFNEFDPKELGNQLDEIMSDLVYTSRDEDDFGRTLSYHHYTLRKLRDIFWCLPAIAVALMQTGKLSKSYSQENWDETTPNPSSDEQRI